MAIYEYEKKVVEDDVKSRVIVKTESVEKTEKFTIAQLERQILEYDKEIERLEEYKSKLQAKIDDAKVALEI